MLKLKLQYFHNLMGRTDSLEKTLMLGKFEGGRMNKLLHITLGFTYMVKVVSGMVA